MNLLIFDLDGTLVDSKQDLIDPVNATRGSMNMAPLPAVPKKLRQGQEGPVRPIARPDPSH